jgi:N-methylhydantoinase B
MTRHLISQIPNGTYRAEDVLDNDGISEDPIRIRVRIDIRGSKARVDFSGTDPQVAGSVNAVYAITASAVFYVFRTLVPVPIPSTEGGMRPLEIVAPEGTVVNARPPAAVSGGNVETSQRIVDVLYRCLAAVLPDRIPAASQGTMNNVSFGGTDPSSGKPFAYYETIAGGMGARPEMAGLSGVHTHMTNSMNTPIEAIEYAYPVRIEQYGLRPDSGGEGRWRGGDGIVRKIRFLAPTQLTVLSDRRISAPYGLNGGKPGRAGRNHIRRRNGLMEELPSKFTLRAEVGDVLSIETPGGGGWGRNRSKVREGVD